MRTRGSLVLLVLVIVGLLLALSGPCGFTDPPRGPLIPSTGAEGGVPPPLSDPAADPDAEPAIGRKFATTRRPYRNLRPVTGFVTDPTKTGELTVVVTRDGSPVAGAEIRLAKPDSAGESASSRTIGVARFPVWPGLESKTYTDFEPPRRAGEIEPPVAGKLVGVTGANGEFRGPVQQGPWIVKVRAGHLSNDAAGGPGIWVDARGGRAEIALQPALQLRGRCLDEDGLPIEGYWLRATQMDGSRWADLPPVRTEPDGTFELRPVLSVPYRVRAFCPRGPASGERLLGLEEPLPSFREDGELVDVMPVRDYAEFRLRAVLTAVLTIRSDLPIRTLSSWNRLVVSALRTDAERRELVGAGPKWSPVVTGEPREGRLALPITDLRDFLLVSSPGLAPAVVSTEDLHRFEVHLDAGRRLRGTALKPGAKEQILVYLLVGDWPVYLRGAGLRGTTWQLDAMPTQALELRRRQDGKIIETLRIEAGAKDRDGIVFGEDGN